MTKLGRPPSRADKCYYFIIIARHIYTRSGISVRAGPFPLRGRPLPVGNLNFAFLNLVCAFFSPPSPCLHLQREIFMNNSLCCLQCVFKHFHKRHYTGSLLFHSTLCFGMYSCCYERGSECVCVSLGCLQFIFLLQTMLQLCTSLSR